MDKTLLSLSRFFALIPLWILRRRWRVLLLLTGSTLFMAWGAATRTTLDMTIDSFIDQDDPAIAALNEFREQFGSDDSVFLVYRALDGDVFSAQSLRAVQALTRELENWQQLDPADYPVDIDGEPVLLDELGKIRRVQSLTTARVQSVDGDTLRSDRLVPEQLPETPEGLRAIRERALAEDDYRLLFYSADGRYAGILIQTIFGAEPVEGFTPQIDAADISLDLSFSAFDAGDSFALDFDEDAAVQDIPFQTVDMFEYSQFFTAIRAVYTEHADVLEFYPVGNPPMNEFIYRMLQQMMLLGVAMIGIFVGLLWVLFRSMSAVLWPILTIALSLAWTWGATAWLGVPMSTMIVLTCLLIFACGIADCVHVMSAYFGCRRDGMTHELAVETA